MGSSFKRQAVRTAYRERRASAHGEELRWLVNSETFLDASTGQAVSRGILRHPGVAVVAPITSGDRIVLLRQYRYSLDGELWELPAGTIAAREEDARMVATEAAVDCARRELREEAGYDAADLREVAKCYAMPGTSDEIIHVFIARGLELRHQDLDVGEVITEVRDFSRAELKGMLARAELHDAKTVIGLFYALTSL